MKKFLCTEYDNCILCPRECGVNRTTGHTGACGMSSAIIAARAALHKWEEPCLSGQDETRGAGTVFFSGCSLRCAFCQNKPISSGDTTVSAKSVSTYNDVVGKEVSVERLVDIFFSLEQQGAYNIDLVTPSHFVPSIREAITISKNRGISIPFVYNSSGYEKADTLKTLNGLIDIYLPDFKYFDNSLALKFSGIPNYFEYASSAVAEMFSQCSDAIFTDDGMMQKGVIVRHLCLPGHTDDSKNVIKYLYDTYGNDIFYSILNQFTPVNQIANYPELNRKLTEDEYDSVVDYAIDLGVENGFIQEGEAALESFIPLFECEGI